MGKDRRADAVLFGFDFQVNAAIVLMIENMKEMKQLRLESVTEDIDIELTNNKHILAQAKSVVNSSTDFSNVRKNLKKSLISLSEGGSKFNVEKFVFVTNSPNPFNDEESKFIFYGPSIRGFESLPEKHKELINEYLLGINQPLKKDNFYIQIIPFETDNDSERYKVVMQKINDFIGDLKIDVPGIGKRLHSIWRNYIFTNGTKKDVNIVLSKKELIWPIIVIDTDIERKNNTFIERLECDQYDEVVRNYRSIIDYCSEKFELFTKILFDYNSYYNKGKDGEKIYNFIKDNWKNYSKEFEESNIDSFIVEQLTKIIIYNIVCKRYDIDRIKLGVAL